MSRQITKFERALAKKTVQIKAARWKFSKLSGKNRILKFSSWSKFEDLPLASLYDALQSLESGSGQQQAVRTKKVVNETVMEGEDDDELKRLSVFGNSISVDIVFIF